MSTTPGPAASSVSRPHAPLHLTRPDGTSLVINVTGGGVMTSGVGPVFFEHHGQHGSVNVRVDGRGAHPVTLNVPANPDQLTLDVRAALADRLKRPGGSDAFLDALLQWDGAAVAASFPRRPQWLRLAALSWAARHNLAPDLTEALCSAALTYPGPVDTVGRALTAAST